MRSTVECRKVGRLAWEFSEESPSVDTTHLASLDVFPVGTVVTLIIPEIIPAGTMMRRREDGKYEPCDDKTGVTLAHDIRVEEPGIPGPDAKKRDATSHRRRGGDTWSTEVDSEFHGELLSTHMIRRIIEEATEGTVVTIDRTDAKPKERPKQTWTREELETAATMSEFLVATPREALGMLLGQTEVDDG